VEANQDQVTAAEHQAEDLGLARWPAWRTVPKRHLVAASQNAGLAPRPNWLHASNEEFGSCLADLCAKLGLEIKSKIELDRRKGRHHAYQTIGAWSVQASGARVGAISWDTIKGDVGGKLVGSAYAPLVEAIPNLILQAEELAQIQRQNLHAQVALAMMNVGPCAPFVSIAPDDRAVWILFRPHSDHGRRVRKFMARLDLRLNEWAEPVGSSAALERAIRRSRENARRKYGARVGWTAISDRSHDQLLEELHDGRGSR
jgi:hypothetical protein